MIVMRSNVSVISYKKKKKQGELGIKQRLTLADESYGLQVYKSSSAQLSMIWFICAIKRFQMNLACSL